MCSARGRGVMVLGSVGGRTVKGKGKRAVCDGLGRWE